MMTQPEEFKIIPTRRMNLAEFKAGGEWKFINAFSAGGAWMVNNGVLMPNTEAGGWIDGIMMGIPIFQCGLCGWSTLVHHYTLKNKLTGEMVNVGSECLREVLNPKMATQIIQGLESLRSKVEREFKRIIYHKQLTQWLKDNVNQLNVFQNEYVDKELAKNPELYWSQPTEVVFQFDERGQNVMEHNEEKGRMIPVAREVKVPEVRRKKDAAYHERRARNYWVHMNEVFESKDWNPTNMAKSFRSNIAFYKQVVFEVPKMRKLTEDEKREIGRLQQVKVDEFVNRITREETK